MSVIVTYVYHLLCHLNQDASHTAQNLNRGVPFDVAMSVMSALRCLQFK